MRTRKRTAPSGARTAGCVSLLSIGPTLMPAEPLPPGFVLLTTGWVEDTGSTERIGSAELAPDRIVLLPHAEPVHRRAGGSLGTGGGFAVVGGADAGGLIDDMGLVGTGPLDCGAERGISAKLGKLL